MKILIAAAALLLCTQAAAQGLHKCRDAAGKFTYASQPCEELGLKGGGEIQDRSSVAPAYKAPPAAKGSTPAPAAKAPTPAPAAQAAEPKQERRCFTIQTAKGPATRCNDVPEEEKK